MIGEPRTNGRLKPNSFIQLRTANVAGLPVRAVEDLGDADQILSNRAYFKRRLRQGGIL